MRIFAVKQLEEIKGKVSFFKLEIDNVFQIDEFESEIALSTSYLTEAKTIKSYMDLYSSGQRLPRNHFKLLKVKGSKHSFFEFKSKHLRYYGFIYNGCMIVCTGEMNDKSEQNADINRVVSICDEYFKQYKELENGKKRINK